MPDAQRREISLVDDQDEADVVSDIAVPILIAVCSGLCKTRGDSIRDEVCVRPEIEALDVALSLDGPADPPVISGSADVDADSRNVVSAEQGTVRVVVNRGRAQCGEDEVVGVRLLAR